jgi:hypothetical protein
MSTAAHFVAQTTVEPGFIGKKALWTGRVLTGLVTAFLLFDATIHLLRPAPVAEAFARLHLSLGIAVYLGVIELACIALYVFPRTSILGAIFLTGYLGGAIATQMPYSKSFFGETLFPVYVAAFIWGGLYLRDERLRALVPWRR